MSVARLYRVGTPYNGVDLAEIDFEQSADVMYLAHINYTPTKLIRHAHDSWEFASITFGPTISPPTGLGVVINSPNITGFSATYARYVVTGVDDDTGQESRASSYINASNDLTLKGNNNFLSWTGTADRYRIYRSHNQQDFGYIGT